MAPDNAEARHHAGRLPASRRGSGPHLGDTSRELAGGPVIGWWIGPASGAEGMWPPSQLPMVADALAGSGIAIPAREMAEPRLSPAGAVVQIDGCTGSFVSPDGLLLTTARCVDRLLARG